MKLLPGDIIITRSRGTLFGKLILKIMRMFQNDRVKYQHIAMVVNNDMAIEALSKVELTCLKNRFSQFEKYKIIRCRTINNEERQNIVDIALQLEGVNYSFCRLFFQFLDQIFQTNFFTNQIRDPRFQICSSLVAWAYHMAVNIEFNNVDWKSCEPDDIDDESIKNPNMWKTIIEWER